MSWVDEALKDRVVFPPAVKVQEGETATVVFLDDGNIIEMMRFGRRLVFSVLAIREDGSKQFGTLWLSPDRSGFVRKLAKIAVRRGKKLAGVKLKITKARRGQFLSYQILKQEEIEPKKLEELRKKFKGYCATNGFQIPWEAAGEVPVNVRKTEETGEEEPAEETKKEKTEEEFDEEIEI